MHISSPPPRCCGLRPLPTHKAMPNQALPGYLQTVGIAARVRTTNPCDWDSTIRQSHSNNQNLGVGISLVFLLKVRQTRSYVGRRGCLHPQVTVSFVAVTLYSRRTLVILRVYRVNVSYLGVFLAGEVEVPLPLARLRKLSQNIFPAVCSVLRLAFTATATSTVDSRPYSIVAFVGSAFRWC